MIAPPQAVIAEVTHRCPMHCVYCSNPIEMQNRDSELSTDVWKKIIHDAAEMGCWHLHLTGGEPLSRSDVPELIAAGRRAGLYVNLITSGLGLTRERLQQLIHAGLDHIQLSFQDEVEASANLFAGTRAHAYKLRVAEWIQEHRVAFTVNIVVHRGNIDRLSDLIALGERLRADKLEIANTQYYGWALKNRAHLLPTRAQLDKSVLLVANARERWKGKMRIDFVLPDYYAKYPKACMGGWGRGVMLIDPAGNVMPCHAAGVIPGMGFENAQQKPLRWIWEHSSSFQQFRGDAWMPELCRSCERKDIDFGGCRCQALLLAGDAAATDPTCSKSAMREVVEQILVQVNGHADADAAREGWVYRIDPVNRV
ncbi:MAG: pyrroloquinoline quinone biosynthesis protein PqqE [Bryobacteraceae bacterium]